MSDHIHNRCRECGYVLEGLSQARCPECGHLFDLADAGTYLSPPEQRFQSRAAGWVAWIAFIHLLTLLASATAIVLSALNLWLPGGMEFGCIGLAAAATAPAVFLACALTGRRSLVWLGFADLMLGILW